MEKQENLQKSGDMEYCIGTYRIIEKLPVCWHGLFGAMRACGSEKPVEVWYQNMTKSQYGQVADWDGLLLGLCDEEPVCQVEKLIFKTRFSLLPSDIQRHLVTFLIYHREELPLLPLTTFVTQVEKELDLQENSTLSYVLFKSLSSYLKTVKEKKEYLFQEDSYKFSTHENELLEASLLETLSYINPPTLWSHSLPDHDNRVTNISNSQHDHGGKVNSRKSELICSSGTGSNQSDISIESQDHDVCILDEASDQSQTKYRKIQASFADLNSSQHQTGTPGSLSVLSQSLGNLGNESIEITEGNLISKAERLKEAWISEGVEDVPSEMDFFLMATPSQVKSICVKLNLDKLSDLAVSCACEHLVTLSSVVSHNNTVEFLESTLYPKIKVLEQKASRQLCGVVSCMAEKFPKALFEGVFALCVKNGLGSPHADLICRVIKEVPSYQILLIQLMNECKAEMTEPVISVYQTLLDQKLQLSESLMSELLSVFGNSSWMEKNLKFGKLLLALINKYSHILTKSHIEVLSQHVQKHNSFLKKSLDSALRKIQI